METVGANTANEIFGPGLGQTQLGILMSLKRLGPTTQARIAELQTCAPATLREHLRSLTLHGLVERRGNRAGKRGRPEVVYALTQRAEALFPRREAVMLQELVAYLLEQGQGDLLDRFFQDRVARRRPDAMARVQGLAGLARFQAVARILSEQGYLANASDTPEGPTLRLCHCPIRDVVRVTELPCHYEQALIAELLDRPLRRDEYIPDGEASCSYSVLEGSPNPPESA